MAHTAFIKTGSLALTALMLCACSSVPQDGVVATDLTGSMTQMWSSVFSGQLRRAPQPQYVFSGSDATLNTPQLVRRVEQQAPTPNYYTRDYARMAPQPPQFNQTRPVIRVPQHVSAYTRPVEPSFERTSLEHYESYRPQKLAALPEIETLSPTAARPPLSQPVVANPAIQRDAYPIEPTAETTVIDDGWQDLEQEEGDSLSYVKIGGGSDIADWQGCESQAGTYFLPTESGFVVAPEFDSCMRVKGYKPEAEAQRELLAVAG